MRITRILGLIWKPLSLVGSIYWISVLGFIWTNHVSFYNGVYWGVITMSTVGYGDIVPTNDAAKAFAMLLAISTIGLLGYSVSTITTIALQAREEEQLGLGGTRMTGHTLLLGWTPVSRAALQELLLSGKKVAVMTRRQDALAEIRTFVANLLREARKNPELRTRLTDERDVFVAFGEYSERAALNLLNVEGATQAVVASDDDARNVLTALVLKELAPHLRIVVAVLREELRETLQAAGVTYVLSPSDLGGRLVSAAAIQPEVAKALDDVTTTAYGSTIDQYEVNERNPLGGLGFDEAHRKLRQATGALLIGLARPVEGGSSSPQGKYRVDLDPPSDTRIERGHYVLVLSSLKNIDRLRAWMGVPPGRPRD
jgi:voltage-gated potassium channel